MKKNIERIVIITVLLLIVLASVGCTPTPTPTPRPYKKPGQITPEIQKQTIQLLDVIVSKQIELNTFLQSDASIDDKVYEVQYFANSLELLLYDYPQADENLRMYTITTQELFAQYAIYLEANKNREWKKVENFLSAILVTALDSAVAARTGNPPMNLGEQEYMNQQEAEQEAIRQDAYMAVKLSTWYSETNRLYEYLAKTYNFAAIEQPLAVTEVPTNTPIVKTNTPAPPATQTPFPTETPSSNQASQGPSNCSLSIGQKVTVIADTRYWSQPNVVGASFTDVATGNQYYILSGPVHGTVHYDSGSKGWWWEVGNKNGKSLGWIWEQKFEECR